MTLAKRSYGYGWGWERNLMDMDSGKIFDGEWMGMEKLKNFEYYTTYVRRLCKFELTFS